MGWFSEWLRRRSRQEKRAGKRHRQFRPLVAELETRVVPAVTATQFVNHGGPVLAQPQVELVYLGQAWTSDTSLQTQVNQFAQYLVGSPFMDVLAQYGVSHGTVAGSVVVPDALGGNVSPLQIQNTLSLDIANGTLPAPGPNEVYVVLTPPNVTVKDNPFAQATFLGYHSSLFDSQGNQDAYAVIPYPGGPNPSTPGLTAFQSLTDTFSHELAEAATDPYVDAQGNPSGWDDYTFDPSGNIYQGEVGDIGASAPTVYLNSYAVTQLWSNQVEAVVAPARATTTPGSGTLTVTGQDVPNAVAGQPITVVVANVTDTFASTGTLTATINWGDRSTPDTNVPVTTDAGGNLVVLGTHTYSGSGSFTITVTVTDGTNTSQGTATATVAAPALLTVTTQDVSAQTGQSFSGTVATVGGTDATAANLANLTATIDWGDGTTPDTKVPVTTDASGNLVVQGTHTYMSAGHDTMAVTVSDSTDQATATGKGTANITAPATPGTLTVTGQNISPVTGQPFVATVATVSDPGSSGRGLVAEIDWGDGSWPSLVRLQGPDAQGNFDVVGWHNYLTNGNYTIAVTVLNRFTGDTGTGTATASVADSGGLSVTAQRINATAGTSFTGTVATVTDPGASAATLTATINWGDGKVDTNVPVTTDSSGNLIVQGTHTYANAGNYPVTVTVTDSSTGNRAQDVALADVDPAPVTNTVRVTGVNVKATAGQSFTDGIAIISAPGASASDLKVTVDWGDKSTDNNVQVVPFGTNGVFVVIGTHTYASSGQDLIGVTVTDSATSATASASSTAYVDVTPPATPTPPVTTPPTTTTPPIATPVVPTEGPVTTVFPRVAHRGHHHHAGLRRASRRA
jgi:hypothetical protein